MALPPNDAIEVDLPSGSVALARFRLFGQSELGARPKVPVMARARKRRARSPALVSAMVAMTALLAPAPPAQSAEGARGPHLFAAHALALRAAGVEEGQAAAFLLAKIPGAAALGAADDLEEGLSLLWRPFFDNAMVRLGRMGSPAPVALYYNPLLDVALFTRWAPEEDGYRVASIRALPGERLADRNAEASPRPQWMVAGAEPIQVLSRNTAARLDTFASAHPAKERNAGSDGVTFAAAAADLRAVLPRLVWNAAQRARWTAEPEPWLGRALARVQKALAASEEAVLTAAAPETDPESAAVLARLPTGFARRLVLDMVLASSGQERLLIGSLPDEGDLYVFVLCRLDGDACALRRIVPVSLLG